MATNTGKGKGVGFMKNRYQKKNSRTGLWDKYDKRGNYVGTKKTGGRAVQKHYWVDRPQPAPSLRA